MNVRCISARKIVRDGSYSLTVGKTYPVLSVEFYDHAKSLFSQTIGDFCLYRIKDDEGIIKPFPSGLFATVSGEIPADWVFYRDTDHSVSLLPQAWAYPSFWDDFYNDEQAAMDAVRKVIMDMGSQIGGASAKDLYKPSSPEEY